MLAAKTGDGERDWDRTFSTWTNVTESKSSVRVGNRAAKIQPDGSGGSAKMHPGGSRAPSEQMLAFTFLVHRLENV